MKNELRKMLFLLSFSLLCLLFAASACAEAAVSEQAPAKVIVEFEPLGDAAAVETEFKLALVTLSKRFPQLLSVRLEGENSSRLIPVSWRCREDYDAPAEVYHFEPVLEGYTLSAETEAPVLSVTVLGESCTPPLSAARDGRESEIPIVGTRSKSADAQQESYDSFEAGRLPAVRNQAPYGSCWAFGTIGAMEADLITDGAGTDIDLSELHLAYYGYHGFYDEKKCSVGDEFDYTEDDWLDQGSDPRIAARVRGLRPLRLGQELYAEPV